MPICVVFNRQTGEIVHTHVEEAEGRTSVEGLLAHVDPSQQRSLLEVTIVKDLVPGKCYRIDPKTRKLQPVDPDQTPGFGSGAARPLGVSEPPPGIKTVYSRET